MSCVSGWLYLLKHGLVSERFLSDERCLALDIDVDFDGEKREIILYAYYRWGRDHAAMASTLITLQRKLSIRDVGKTPGIALDALNMLASLSDIYEGRLCDDFILVKTLSYLSEFTKELRHFPRRLGIDSDAMIPSDSRLSWFVSIEPGRNPGRTVVQWDKDSLEDVGIVKIDLLGLQMLAAIAECQS